jgi:hypothetical protein
MKRARDHITWSSSLPTWSSGASFWSGSNKWDSTSEQPTRCKWPEPKTSTLVFLPDSISLDHVRLVLLPEPGSDFIPRPLIHLPREVAGASWDRALEDFEILEGRLAGSVWWIVLWFCLFRFADTIVDTVFSGFWTNERFQELLLEVQRSWSVGAMLFLDLRLVRVCLLYPSTTGSSGWIYCSCSDSAWCQATSLGPCRAMSSSSVSSAIAVIATR